MVRVACFIHVNRISIRSSTLSVSLFTYNGNHMISAGELISIISICVPYFRISDCAYYAFHRFVKVEHILTYDGKIRAARELVSENE